MSTAQAHIRQRSVLTALQLKKQYLIRCMGWGIKGVIAHNINTVISGKAKHGLPSRL